MEQTNIYDYLMKDEDPIYKLLNTLQPEQSVEISEFTITLNTFGLLEVTSEEVHECFSSLDKCYLYLSEMSHLQDLT